MPAPLVNGVILIGAIVAVLGAVVIAENPQAREWAEEQRRKLAELLRNFGDQLDPRTRSTAEAYAFQGREPRMSRRESQGASNAAAVATGVSVGDAVNRRYTARPSQNLDSAADRRRMGREYLARRNQEMLDRQSRSGSRVLSRQNSTDHQQQQQQQPEMQERGKSITSSNRPATFNTSSSHTWTAAQESSSDALPQKTPVLIDTDDSFQQVPTQTQNHAMAARYADPFSDEHELFHSPLHTPTRLLAEKKPPVQESGQANTEPLAFEDQLARALSLSLAESEERKRRQEQINQRAMSAAIAASLVEHNQNRTVVEAKPVPLLVDFEDRGEPTVTQTSTRAAAATYEDDLYSLTPQATGAARAPVESIDASIDEFASMTASSPHSEAGTPVASDSSVVDVQEAEVHSVSSDDEQTGVLTPDSWSEVGSRIDEDEHHQVAA